MAKRRHEQPEPLSSRTTLTILAVGGLLAAGLVAWALTRTVETSPPAAAPPMAVGSEQTAALPSPTQTAPPSTQGFTPPPAATGSLDGSAVMNSAAAVPRIAAEDLKGRAERGEVTIIDVRDDASFAKEHIPGAVHIPLARIEGEMGTLPKNKPIVTYCT